MTSDYAITPLITALLKLASKAKKIERRRLQSLYASNLHENKSSTKVHYI